MLLETNTLTAPPTVPDDGPFDEHQRRFVEGFLAGLASVKRNLPTDPAAADVAGTPLTVLYGSQSGNCEALAKQLRKRARAAGFKPDVAALNDLAPADLADVRHLLILCSTFGEGDPPDNARRFHQWLLSDEAPQLPDLHYSVCALGDRSYTHFCKTGRDIDERLAALGAVRLAERVDCDVAYDEDFEQWATAVFNSEPMVAAAGEVRPGPTEPETSEDPDAGPIGWSKQHPFPATVLRVQCLNRPGSAKEVNHVELSLAGSGMEYQVGDALGVWPVNCCRHVEEILDLLGFTGDEPVAIQQATHSIRDALLRRLDLNTLTPKVTECLGVDCPEDGLADHHLIDLLKTYRPACEPQALADGLRPLQPRLYSIASSPKAHPGQVHLTVGAVRYQLHDQPRQGVCSTYFADRLNPGALVGVYVQKAAHFALPEDNATPIIMVGPGTGIAPFRAFLEERHERGGSGPCWLFFGDRNEATDFLYRDELMAMKQDRLLTRLDLAWSRDGESKVYVQHRMRDAGAELFQWLETGAHFYVCGDAKRMAHDVDRALRDLVAEHGNMTADDAAAYVQRLIDEHRYQRDVY